MPEALTLRKHSKQNTDKLINNSNHSLFIAAELRVLPPEILPEHRTPLNNTCSHLIEDIPQVRIPLLRNTHLNPHRTRLLNNRVSAGILNNLLPAPELFDTSHLSNKPPSKERRYPRNGRNDAHLLKKIPFYLLSESRGNLLGMRDEEEKLIHVEQERSLKSPVGNTDRPFSKVKHILWRKGGFPALCPDITVSYSLFTCSGNERGRGERTDNRKESRGKDIKVVFGLWEEDREEMFDLSFTFSNIVLNSLKLSCEELDGRDIRGSIFNERGIEGCKGSYEESIPPVCFRRIGRRVELDKAVNSFRVNNFHVDAFLGEKNEERDVESSGGFHDNGRWGIRREEFEERGETFKGVRERVFFDYLALRVDDTDVEGTLGNVNACVEHGDTSNLVLSELSLTSILPFGGGFKAQSTYWELRDRGTDSFRGFRAYEIWSPCPSSSLTGNLN